VDPISDGTEGLGLINDQRSSRAAGRFNGEREKQSDGIFLCVCNCVWASKKIVLPAALRVPYSTLRLRHRRGWEREEMRTSQRNDFVTPKHGRGGETYDGRQTPSDVPHMVATSISPTRRF
jgi:hypothetical protein